ncbi:hypothetical protein B5S30_g4951 [[Candida] boidinii]|nr:hypothetical protein B5S30_g4951 [[Candida] boidinii]
MSQKSNNVINTNKPVAVKRELKSENEPLVPSFDSYQLNACTQEDIDETRFHILKFNSVKKVDFKKFHEPARLHRKDPRNLQFQLSLKELEESKIERLKMEREKVEKRKAFLKRKRIEKGLDPEEVEEMEIDAEKVDEEMEMETLPEEEKKQREEAKKREEEKLRILAKREADLALVAPDGGARKPKKNLFKKKTRQIKVYDEEKRRLRYEEYYPWVLEDYDGDNVYVGNYQAQNAQSDTYVLLVLDNVNNCFKMVPVEKFYDFKPRNKYATLTLEEAEDKYKENKSRTSRWLMQKMEDEVVSGQRVDARYRRQMKVISNNGDKRSDGEEFDYDEEFQDDEEAPIVEGNDEENKESEKRIKREMLRASNLLPVDENANDDDDDDFDELFGTSSEKKVDKEGKKLRQALSKSAMNEVYDSDDENENPYLSESDIESDDQDENKVKNENEDEEMGNGRKEDSTGAEDGASGSENKGESSVKTEDSQTSYKKDLYVASYSDGIILLRGTKEILSQFRKGVWNANKVPKRAPKDQLEDQQPKSKKFKSIVKSEPGEEAIPSSDVLTKEDIEAVIDEEPIQISKLLRALRPKIGANPIVNKPKFKELLKTYYVLKDKQITRKN